MSSILSCRTARVYPSILINHEGSRRKASWKDPEGRLPGRIQKDESSTSFAMAMVSTSLVCQVSGPKSTTATTTTTSSYSSLFSGLRRSCSKLESNPPQSLFHHVDSQNSSIDISSFHQPNKQPSKHREMRGTRMKFPSAEHNRVEEKDTVLMGRINTRLHKTEWINIFRPFPTEQIFIPRRRVRRQRTEEFHCYSIA
ncbi:hypothetical protein LguiA_011127 [Lonicera macranthoides]